MRLSRYLLLSLIVISAYRACGQDVDFHLNGTFLSGKNILKVKRDFKDPYLWVLAQNHAVYRINSITKIIDDYSGFFSAYHNLQFVDIAGADANTVFVATNSNNILALKNGTIKVIGAAKGIPGTVQSIGLDYTGSYFSDNTNGLGGHPLAEHILLIGTDNGRCNYDYEQEIMKPNPSHVPSQIFDATYRSELFSNLEFGSYPDVVKQYAVVELTKLTIWGGFLWYGNNSMYGEKINTAYTTFGNVIDAMDYGSLSGSLMNQFWGTEKGLFQNFRGYSYYSDNEHHAYLPGINVNKIASIYGLRYFGTSQNKGLIKENLLVGTDQGFYYSNSGYFSFSLFNYSLFHYDALGNTKVNDICVNATSYSSPVCEDGVWVAAATGLYLLKPDYGPYVNPTQQLSSIQFEGQAFNVTQLEICANTTVDAIVQNSAYSGNAIQWYKDGQEIPNESNSKLTIKNSGDYYVVLYDPCSPLHLESNHLKVTQIAAPVFAFDYPDQLNYCEGSVANLKTDNKAGYNYRWYKDGVLNGNTTASLDISENGKYKVEVSACAGNWVSSKEVEVKFIPVPKPVLKQDKAAYCDGEQATISSQVPIDGSQIINWSPYQYRWYRDGVLNGATTPNLQVTQAGKYKVEVRGCSNSWVASDELTIDFINLAKPIIAADKPGYCTDNIASLTTNFTNDGTYTLNWFRDGNLLAAELNKTNITASQPGKYSLSVSSNITACSALSDPYTLNFDAVPDISIQQIVNTNLCDGETVILKASYSNGTVKWQTGEATDQISVNHSGTYTATVSTPGGCIASQSMPVSFLPKPILSVPDASLCQYSNETITLTAPPGFVTYEWNGQPGGPDFNTGSLGTVSLRVTDHNGCSATQTINITSHCDDIHIPNTFTPNGDGANDSWVITGLTKSDKVNVYNRNGTMVFQSQGYAVPWNGAYKGKALPIGVYYYVINTPASKQVHSGAVTIIY
ncbi:gliding motility-associated C-terminal domain-containing protein [Mucilaginibacter gossypiicola]|uniref:Gliding motility-associated C-terminal domain-containing protein n=1 Tax=Mucilaginibacter gossypiicola TaxID=551995 RepID=A0A1H8AF67_9SPHI|nr:gliding motility-associated C-terminal domain-containing protein [Mucilaginibacter gossypiicola]SEM69241.1 gliding motility-associated C-terminal domain-containing protein [Mucilaginibacter gossypiicola]